MSQVCPAQKGEARDDVAPEAPALTSRGEEGIVVIRADGFASRDQSHRPTVTLNAVEVDRSTGARPAGRAGDRREAALIT